jgi:hypothetical protein
MSDAAIALPPPITILRADQSSRPPDRTDRLPPHDNAA